MTPQHQTVGARKCVPTATAPREVPAGARLDHPHLFFNRELSWLDFCARVLEQARDSRNPLLERVRFLAYSAEHLDEFFSKRVGGLERMVTAGVRGTSPDGRTPQHQLDLIRSKVAPLYEAISRAWEDDLKPALHTHSPVRILDWDELRSREQAYLKALFLEHVFPVLTPLAVDPGHPFPHISHLSVSLAIVLRHPARGTRHFARMKVPRIRGRWLAVGRPHVFVPLEQVVAANLTELFPGMDVVGAWPFRVTRSADLGRYAEDAAHLISSISDQLRLRRVAPIVRLEVVHSMPGPVRNLLQRHLSLGNRYVYEASQQIDLSDCKSLALLPLPHLQYPALSPVIPAAFAPRASENVFARLRESDILVHHPYDSFAQSVSRFIEVAVDDDLVRTVGHTFYRTNEESPILESLIEASKAGKRVRVVVEINARYDEERNIAWARRLEEAGVEVSYGLRGLKTHAKATLVVRTENGAPRGYCHVATGNYNSDTAKKYADVGLFTCDPDICGDVARMFDFLTGRASGQQFRKLMVAPVHLRGAFTDLIRRERRFGVAGRITAVMNGLDDAALIRELYRAARSGVRIDLVVRGLCRLRPRHPSYGGRIRVFSIVGRFYEDLRVVRFRNGGEPEFFIGSADWMRRNLDERVETAVPVEVPALRRRLESVLEHMLAETRNAWELHADGRYVRRAESGNGTLYERLMREAAGHNDDREIPLPQPDR